MIQRFLIAGVIVLLMAIFWVSKEAQIVLGGVALFFLGMMLLEDGMKSFAVGTLEVILKKNGIMLNSFEIQGFYPFLNNETRIISKALGRLNAQKALYKKQVKKVVGLPVAKHLIKQYGTTDIGYLFEKNFDLLIKVLKSDFINGILSKAQINRIRNKPEFYEFIFQLLYIYLFNELIISGKYDSEFEYDNMNLPLSNFL